MKKLSIALCLVCFFRGACAQVSDNQIAASIASANKDIADGFIGKNLDRVMLYYDDQSVYMPEHHIVLSNKKDIRNYFQQWINSVSINEIKKTKYEIHRSGSYAIETGTFESSFHRPNKNPVQYNGKYICVWKNSKIVSEIWGADHYIDRDTLSFLPKASLSGSIYSEGNKELIAKVESQDKKVADLVVARNGKDINSYYTPDAIYMPYYSPMLIGNKKIGEYYVEHEDPKVFVDSLKIGSRKVIDMGDLVLEDQYYYIEWRVSPQNKGTITGKGINIWKRFSDGRLLLFRQMVNHD